MSMSKPDPPGKVDLFRYVLVETKIRRKGELSLPLVWQRLDGNFDDAHLSYTGYLKALDPISGSVAICDIVDEQVTHSMLIFGHNIASISYKDDENLLQPASVKDIIETHNVRLLSDCPFFMNENLGPMPSEENLAKRKDRIIEFIKANRISVAFNELDRSITVAESVIIKPPYKRDSDFICPTKLIKRRIKTIIDDYCG